MSSTLIFLILLLTGTLHIQFVVNMDRIVTWVYGSPQYALEEPITEETIENQSQTLVDFATEHGFFSWHPLIGTVGDNPGEVELICKLLEKVHEEIISPDQRIFTTAEFLSKVVAYRNLKEGDKIPFADGGPEFRTHPLSLSVETLFNLWKGIPAFGLVPEEEGFDAILLFRGTDFFSGTKQSFYSILSNLDQKGVAFSLFKKAQPEIHRWLKEMQERGSLATVIGYSQGGALAMYTAIYERDYIGEAIAFNPPGIAEELQQRWSSMTLPLTVFISQGDFVSKKGSLFGKVYVLFLTPIRAPIATHVTLISGEAYYKRVRATIP